MRLAILATRVRMVFPGVYSQLHLVRDRDPLAEQSRWVRRNVAGGLVLSLLAVVTLTWWSIV